VEHPVARDARIVDQNVDRAEIGLDLLDAFDAGIVIGDRPFVDRIPVSSLNLAAASSLPA
jgi:hypothetical protein